jgi:transglycosylase-like protein with SLT domain
VIERPIGSHGAARPLRATVLAATLAAAALAGLLACGLVAALARVPLAAGGEQGVAGRADGVSALARRDIPARALLLYERAALRYGLDWAVLAGIGKVECDHGRDPDPSCSQPGAVNYAGAGGPMQFLATTWARYGVDGNGDGVADRWSQADAIYAAANYLRAAGAPADYTRALLAYNHARWYVSEVEAWAARYRGAQPIDTPSRREGAGEAQVEAGAGGGLGVTEQTTTPVRLIAGEHAVLAPGDGHIALIPVEVPATVQAMLVAGNELQQLRYGPGGHPDPRGALEEDCSSTVNYVLYRAGVRPIAEILRENPLAQDYVRWGDPGPGRWVTIYATDSPTPHVFMTIAGLRLDTSHAGTDVGPNSAQDGPRWRILDRIPAWARWSVRHPAGL